MYCKLSKHEIFTNACLDLRMIGKEHRRPHLQVLGKTRGSSHGGQRSVVTTPHLLPMMIIPEGCHPLSQDRACRICQYYSP